MKRFLALALVTVIVASCNDKDKTGQKQTILTGEVTVITDQTLTPIIEDQIAVFENEYQAKFNLISKSEGEVINELLNGSIKVGVLARKLSADEQNVFNQRKIYPKTTQFATDAIAFIRNSADNDSLIALQDVINFINGKPVERIEGLVFDNPNSSTARELATLAKVNSLPENGIFSFNTNAEAIKYISENRRMIGVVGLNWISQTPEDIQKYKSGIKVLSVKSLDGSEYVAPSQSNIAEGKYPLARDLFVVDCQGFAGLGKGFSSFIAGERGQRIILKSGLLPIRIPHRKIITRSQIQKVKSN
ncbi:MAG: substrate-binding domain-containing protein [Flavobacterium sp.]|nr:substrate-binding domain-containing protein [Flavobacterium sp.]